MDSANPAGTHGPHCARCGAEDDSIVLDPEGGPDLCAVCRSDADERAAAPKRKPARLFGGGTAGWFGVPGFEHEDRPSTSPNRAVGPTLPDGPAAAAGRTKAREGAYLEDEMMTIYPPIGTDILIRANRAGVWAGTLDAIDGDRLRLTGARRLWSWTGALDCSVLAVRGPTGGRAGDPTTVVLGPSAEIIEVHVLSPVALAAIRGLTPWAR